MSFHVQLVLRPAAAQVQSDSFYAEEASTILPEQTVEKELENLSITNLRSLHYSPLHSDALLREAVEKDLGCNIESTTGDVLCRLAYEYEVGIDDKEKSYAKTIFCLQTAVDKGCVAAQFHLGILYEKGFCINGYVVGQSDQAAFRWIKLAADNGHDVAIMLLARLYKAGKGTEQSYEKAAACYQRLVSNGFSYAQFELARMYECGHGVEQSYEKAAELFMASAMHNNERAAFQMSKLYFVGQGVERSPELAELWYNKAILLKQASDEIYA